MDERTSCLCDLLWNAGIHYAIYFPVEPDDHFVWKLGDEVNGFTSEGSAHSEAEAFHAVAAAAVAADPDSELAQIIRKKAN